MCLTFFFFFFSYSRPKITHHAVHYTTPTVVNNFYLRRRTDDYSYKNTRYYHLSRHNVNLDLQWTAFEPNVCFPQSSISHNRSERTRVHNDRFTTKHSEMHIIKNVYKEQMFVIHHQVLIIIFLYSFKLSATISRSEKGKEIKSNEQHLWYLEGE